MKWNYLINNLYIDIFDSQGMNTFDAGLRFQQNKEA